MATETKENWERVCYAVFLAAAYEDCSKPGSWPITKRWVAENNFLICGYASDWNRARTVARAA